ncbi:hypothetical protein [Streptomyces paromomycinus]|uniref:DeoR family transcriptional regulator n=1 Tax=Streptomyces paromomycinus TaxID=92743 RepID=A0A401VUZ7_STREY|nr:hypothetical protein [Streptomyces paromomycinus]GCD40858.1 hypothetical protein GKJPGBOP_00511 [Streptomyces paromomycinus]
MTGTGATAPKPTHQSLRADALLAEARRRPQGRITSGAARAAYARLGLAAKRRTARRDLKALAAEGLLTACGPDSQRYYVANRARMGGSHPGGEADG